MVIKCSKYTTEFKKRAVGLRHVRDDACVEILRELECDAGSVSGDSPGLLRLPKARVQRPRQARRRASP